MPVQKSDFYLIPGLDCYERVLKKHNTSISWYFQKWIPDQHYLILTNINIETIFHDGIFTFIEMASCISIFFCTRRKKRKEKEKKKEAS
jgi:hypothetical protein